MASGAPGILALHGMDLDAVTIPKLQERMQAGGSTAVELMQAYLDRIATVNDEVALAVPQQFSHSCAMAPCSDYPGCGWRLA